MRSLFFIMCCLLIGWGNAEALTSLKTNATSASPGNINTEFGKANANFAELANGLAGKADATATQTALNGKANTSAFASQSAFTSAWGWTPGGSTYTAGTGIDITSGVISSTVTGTLPSATEGQIPVKGATAWEAVDQAVLAFTGNVSRDTGTGVVSVPVTSTATSGSATPFTSGGAYSLAAGKQDTLVSGTNLKTINSTSLLGSGNITITGGSGGGIASHLTASPYSDVACTADGVYNHVLYKCVDNGSGTGYFTEYLATTAYSNETPVDTTPDAFTFTDVTDATLSTDYTALAQINGIAAGITCSGSGGTVAACTGSTAGTCGTFGSTSGTITNGQYVGAKVTSSGSASTAVNNAVTCSGVSDTFTVTTATAGSCTTQSVLLSQTGSASANSGDIYGNMVEAIRVTGNGKKLYSVKLITSTANQGSSAAYSILVNTSLNFSSGNTDSFTITTPGSSSTEFTGFSVSRPVLANGTDYYIGYTKQGADWGDRTNLNLVSGPGTSPINNLWTTYGGLSGTFDQSANQSLWAEVKVCDN